MLTRDSHLIPVPPGPHILSDILVTSPLFFSEEGAAGGGGAGGEAGGAPAAGGGGMGGFAVDPNMDPELAEALRVSLLEEQERKRKEDAEAAKKAGGAAPAAGGEKKPDAVMADIDPNMDPELAEAMRLSMSTAAPEPAKPPAPAKPPVPAPKLDEMSEEEQMRIAMEMSMVAENPATPAPAKPAGATVTPATAPSPATPAAPKQGGDVDMSDVMNDPAFVANLLKTLPGVDTNDPGIKVRLAYLALIIYLQAADLSVQNIISGMQSQNKDEKKDDKKDDKNKK